MRAHRPWWALPALGALVLCSSVSAGAAPALVEEDYTFTSSLDGTGPLYATAVFRKDAKRDPVMVVQTGYGGSRRSVGFSARHMADRGFFCLCIALRGRDRSSGKSDDGGLEIMDIHDGVHAGVTRYGDKLDGSRVSIIGYSNGGGNVFFATVRFPYLFRASMALFGMSDYGMWARLNPAWGKHVIRTVGGTPDELPDKYMARNSCLAAGNLSGTRFHIAYDEQERACPIPMDTAFVNAAEKAGCKNVFLHVSKKTDKHRWRHGYNTKGHLSPIEDRFMDDIEQSKATTPTMPDTGELVVLGFLVTPRFRCVLGRGDDAVAKVSYRFRPDGAEFTFAEPLTSKKDVRATITVPAGVFNADVDVLVGDAKPKTVPLGQAIVFEMPARAAAKIRTKR